MAAKYVVLWLSRGDEALWEVVDEDAEARSPDAAIRSRGTLSGGGTYVAVPARSWKPLEVEVEQVAKVTVRSAT